MNELTPVGTDCRAPHLDEVLSQIDGNLTELQERFGGAFEKEEAKAVVAGFDGDVYKAAKLCREPTNDYVSHMSVEDLISAGRKPVWRLTSPTGWRTYR